MPMEITIKLLENAMRGELTQPHDREGWEDGRGRFLIDGFPRKMDQALKFDEDVICLPCAQITSMYSWYDVMTGLPVDRGPVLYDDRRRDAEASARACQDEWP